MGDGAIAVLSDVHGNTEALRAVLGDLDRLGVREVVVAGDMVGFGPEPDVVVDLLRERGARMIRGNHEQDYVARWDRPDAPPEWRRDRRYRGFALTMERLGRERRAFLAGLPDRLLLDEATLVVHGSPRQAREGLRAGDSDEELAARYAGERCTLSFSGHTHRPLIRCTPGLTLVNVGSVGLSLDRDPRAAYALAEPEPDGPPGRWRVEIRRVAYDLEAAVRAYDRFYRPAAPEYVELITRTLLAARDYFAPGLRAAADASDLEFPDAIRRYLAETS
jgi:predicted phosphodiesterase